MNCFCTSQTASNDQCCGAHELCSFSGSLDDVKSTPIYVQSVYDAVRFNLQGMKTVQGLTFTPAIPCGYTVSRIIDIRCKKVFDPCNANDCSNLTLDMETGISGAYFVNDCNGVVETIGPDGVPSEKILFADTSSCDDTGCGTPVFGTQNVRMWGDIVVYIDLAVCDNCGRETTMTVCAEVSIAPAANPLVLTNFFELCMPSTTNSAVMPRLTELSNAAFTCRLATNNAARDMCVGPNGEITANLIIAICVACEKKIVVPVQLCVLTTGFAEAPLQEDSAGIINCPGLFPERTDNRNNSRSCASTSNTCVTNPCCDPCGPPPSDDCGCGCNDFTPPQCR
ncbi:MAG TPA: hypothetical protein IAC50_06750 [Candidatus Copromorpha excrementigallinarum]|uniref:Uncharacterized protein n=1 Tax=Candidatus Allocopromorpha excrementigallinarum TaxID=2840742 RepID=A0A9D1I0Y4_9FIRM|nr:hypothetical protein [Candidatus Copromorpha excrementigallinarum]